MANVETVNAPDVTEETVHVPTLLEKAQAVTLKRRGGKSTSQEERALAMAWVNGKVSITQVASALNVKTGGVYPFLANALKQEILSRF